MAFCLRAVTNWFNAGVARTQKEIQSFWLWESEKGGYYSSWKVKGNSQREKPKLCIYTFDKFLILEQTSAVFRGR